MRFVPLTMLVALTLVFTDRIQAEDWPTYRHDNTRQGFTPEKLAVPLKSAWVYKAPAPPKTAWAGPDDRTFEGHDLRHRVNYDDTFQVAVVGDRLYFGSSVDHHLHCYDLKTGKSPLVVCHRRADSPGSHGLGRAGVFRLGRRLRLLCGCPHRAADVEAAGRSRRGMAARAGQHDLPLAGADGDHDHRRHRLFRSGHLSARGRLHLCRPSEDRQGRLEAGQHQRSRRRPGRSVPAGLSAHQQRRPVRAFRPIAAGDARPQDRRT